LNRKLPWTPVVSIASVNDRNATPRCFNPSTMRIRCDSDRPRPIELPDYQDVTFAQIGHARLKAGPVIARARGAIEMLVPTISGARVTAKPAGMP